MAQQHLLSVLHKAGLGKAGVSEVWDGPTRHNPLDALTSELSAPRLMQLLHLLQPAAGSCHEHGSLSGGRCPISSCEWVGVTDHDCLRLEWRRAMCTPAGNVSRRSSPFAFRLALLSHEFGSQTQGHLRPTTFCIDHETSDALSFSTCRTSCLVAPSDQCE